VLKTISLAEAAVVELCQHWRFLSIWVEDYVPLISAECLYLSSQNSLLRFHCQLIQLWHAIQILHSWTFASTHALLPLRLGLGYEVANGDCFLSHLTFRRVRQLSMIHSEAAFEVCQH